MKLADNEIAERDLLWGVMHNIRGIDRHGTARWVRVMKTFGCGSSVAYALCREFELDPDEVLKK